MRRSLPLLLLAVLASGASAQDASLDPNRTVATVNGEAIKAGEYYHRLEWFRPDPQSAFIKTPVGFQLLRQMISERMILQLAKSKGVFPTAPELDARVAEAYGQNPNLKAELEAAGRSEADVRADLLTQEAQFKLVTSGVTITDQEVEKHYKDSPSEFQEPTRYKLRIIAVGDDASEGAVDAALKAGRSFADVAKEMSLDLATKNQGGSYGDVPESALSDTTRAAVSSTPVGATSGWVKTAGSEARVKFFVEAVTPAKMVPLDASLRTRIRRRMMLDRGTTKNTVGKDLEAATRAATVTIAQPEFQKLYSELLDRVKGQQAQG